MSHELCITNSDMASLKAELLQGEHERCAVLFAAESRRSDGQLRLLVRELEFAESSDYQSQSSTDAELNPLFVARVTKKARIKKLTLIFVHTHPGRSAPEFSKIDDDGELVLLDFLQRRNMHAHHAALVISNGGIRARFLGKDEDMRVVVLGLKRNVEFDPDLDNSEYSSVFDRQVRAFGATGQHRLEQLRVAIVGLGGTGSIVAQQLVHLGVRRFILIDPDIIEATNLNRVVSATHRDIGENKAAVAAKYLKNFNEKVTIQIVDGDVVNNSVASRLTDADLILCCTDSHGSRSIIQQVAYQYLIPCIDMGSTITQTDGLITGIFGRVQLLAPGLPCLWCSELLDGGEVRRDMMSESERKLDPYIVGAREPAPSVISLNGTVVSLAVTMVLGIVAGASINATQLIYNALTSTVRPVTAHCQPGCFICSKSGVLGYGDSSPLFTRLG